jgi:hypothetical protein
MSVFRFIRIRNDHLLESDVPSGALALDCDRAAMTISFRGSFKASTDIKASYFPSGERAIRGIPAGPFISPYSLFLAARQDG